MHREGDHYFFRTRAPVNKCFQGRLTEVQPGEVRETLDDWVEAVYAASVHSRSSPSQMITRRSPTPQTECAWVNVHDHKECGAVGGGERLNFTKTLFT